ncbi:hypothetical protein MtrunA17_Chr3g0132521 [Medicago truncatula]|uniref:Uncharacterized protein n=1 Tax=Medicago truncatula TaxID=3880 RepID=G7J4H1_MEDTR|nr:hypothetical protein MTR_3g099690 [Medicago truncatula]RHN70154.1 hypothetical protein MtrunA17_Chr3g0132521 [Medicago truncatula]
MEHQNPGVIVTDNETDNRRRRTRTANQLYANQQIQQAAVQRAKKSKSYFRDQGFKRSCLFFTSSLRDPRSLSFRAAYIRLLECDDAHQMCAYVGSLFHMFVPDLKENVIEALSNCGIEVTEVDSDAVLRISGLELEDIPSITRSEFGIIWAYCILCLFKNPSVINYKNYMSSRIAELLGLVHTPSAEQVKIPLRLEHAKNLRQMLGSQEKFCKEVLVFIINNVNKSSFLRSTIQYLDRILAWSNMSSFTIIFESLIMTKSPVIYERFLRAEALKFADTVEAICASDYPQYFRYFAAWTDHMHLLDRNRFPMSIAVAEKIKYDTSSTSVNKKREPRSGGKFVQSSQTCNEVQRSCYKTNFFLRD